MNQPRSALSEHRPWIWAVLAAVAWILLQSWMIQWGTFQARPSLPEPDDSYCYVAKAASLEDDFLQRSPALQSLREQLATPDPRVAPGELGWERERQYHRLHYHYGPLFSAWLVVVKKLLGSWEAAYLQVAVVGSLALGFALSCFLRRLVSAPAAGLAVIVSAGLILPSHGLHTIVPGTLALTFGLFAWSLAHRSDRSAKTWLGITCLLSLAAHPTGLLYAAVAYLFHLTRDGGPLESLARLRSLPSALRTPSPLRTELVRATLVVGGLAALWIASGIPDRPFHPIHFAPPRIGSSAWLHEVAQNLRTLAGLASYLLREHGVRGARPIGLVFAAVAIVVMVRERHALRRLWIALAGTAALIGLSVFLVLPGYPGEAAYRLWVPLTVVLSAGFAEVLVRTAREVYRQRAALSSAWRDVVPLVVMSVWFVSRLVRSPAEVATHVEVVVHRMFDIDLDPTDVDRVRDAEARGAVAFAQETPMYFFLAHGMRERAAVFLPAVEGTPLFDTFAPCSALAFAVVDGPTLEIPPGRVASVTREGSHAELEVVLRTSGIGSFEIDGARSSFGPDQTTHALSFDGARPGLTIRNAGTSPMALMAVRSRAPTSAWAWGERVAVTGPGGETTNLADPTLAVPLSIRACGWTLVSDRGSALVFSRYGAGRAEK